MKKLVRLALGVAALHPVACETTLRVPAAGGSAGVLSTGNTGNAGAEPEAGSTSFGGADSAGGAADGGVIAATGGTGMTSVGSGGTSSDPGEGNTPDNPEAGTGDRGSSSNGDRGGTSPVGTGGGSSTGAKGGGSATGGTEAQPGGAGGEAGAGDIFAEPARCTSGLFRDPDESEGPEMMPGFACIKCHAQSNAASGEGDAPIFAFVGTLFPSAHEPDACAGSAAEGAEVIVRDVNGVEVSVFANAAGNFFFEEHVLMPPITARVRQNGRERVMDTPAAHGDCNYCHTQSGAEDAPGRIVLP